MGPTFEGKFSVRPCPYCKKDIPIDAKSCQYCKEEIVLPYIPEAAKPETSPVTEKAKEKQEERNVARVNVHRRPAKAKFFSFSGRNIAAALVNVIAPGFGQLIQGRFGPAIAVWIMLGLSSLLFILVIGLLVPLVGLFAIVWLFAICEVFTCRHGSGYLDTVLGTRK